MLFKKFTQDESIVGASQVKTSVAKAIRQAIEQQMPSSPAILDVLWPKKAHVVILKCQDKLSLLTINGMPLFFQHYDGPWYPTLRLLHQYPNLLPHFQVDRGAIKFVLSGAHIMCKGLTSPGGKMDEVAAKQPVAIMAEGKQHALGIGLTKMSAADIKKVNDDIGVESVHYLNDGLWLLDPSRLKLK